MCVGYTSSDKLAATGVISVDARTDENLVAIARSCPCDTSHKVTATSGAKNGAHASRRGAIIRSGMPSKAVSPVHVTNAGLSEERREDGAFIHRSNTWKNANTLNYAGISKVKSGCQPTSQHPKRSGSSAIPHAPF